jgi:hypothetical protein
MLHSLKPQPPQPRGLARIRTGRHRRRFKSALNLYERYDSLIAKLHRPSLMDAVEHGGLVIQADGTLFELYVLFAVLDWFRNTGWVIDRPRVFSGRLTVRGARGPQRVAIHYQRVPKLLAGTSRYGLTLAAHGVAPSELRPDLVLIADDGSNQRLLLVELKMSRKRQVTVSVREALKDLLTYEAGYQSTLSMQEGPIGLGVAWGEGLRPVPGRLMLATADHIGEGLDLFLNAGA